MASGHHTTKQPQRISSIGVRSRRALADGRRVSEADLRPAIYVRPYGLGFHVVKNACNDQEYVVADATGSVTFSPGQTVALGSFTGNPGEFILGKPPAGYGGASGYAISAANFPIRTSTPVVAPDGIAFFYLDESHSVASSYVAGQFSADLAETEDLGDALSAWSRMHQNRYLVSRSNSDANLIVVWDIALNTVATHEVASEWALCGVGAVGTTVYWVELEAAMHEGPPVGRYIRLRSAGFDLESPTTVAQRAVIYLLGGTTPFAFSTSIPSGGLGFYLNSSAVILTFDLFPFGGEGEIVGYGVRLPISGATADTLRERQFELFQVGFPGPGGALLMVDGLPHSFPDDEAGSATPIWPDGEEWQTLGSDETRLVSILAGMERLAIFESDALVIGPLAVVEGTSPPIRAEIGSHPTHGQPDLFYVLS